MKNILYIRFRVVKIIWGTSAHSGTGFEWPWPLRVRKFTHHPDEGELKPWTL